MRHTDSNTSTLAAPPKDWPHSWHATRCRSRRQRSYSACSFGSCSAPNCAMISGAPATSRGLRTQIAWPTPFSAMAASRSAASPWPADEMTPAASIVLPKEISDQIVDRTDGTAVGLPVREHGKCHWLWAAGRAAHGVRWPWTFPYCQESLVSRLPVHWQAHLPMRAQTQAVGRLY